MILKNVYCVPRFHEASRLVQSKDIQLSILAGDDEQSLSAPRDDECLICKGCCFDGKIELLDSSSWCSPVNLLVAFSSPKHDLAHVTNFTASVTNNWFLLLNVAQAIRYLPALLMAGSEEDICAGCSLHPLEVSLVLICNHRLCLKCAHRQMHVSEAKGSKLFEAPSYTASCPSCGSATQVEAGAAQQILSMQQSSPDTVQPVPSASISPSVERRTQRSVREGRWTAQSPEPEIALERVLPKPRSPLTSCNLPSPPAEAELQRCGQCQVEAADVRCSQCDEFFCQTCYKRMHHMGRMKEHRYTTIASIPIPKIAHQRTPQTEFCIHHGEPIDFFCIDCTQCLCAECAVHRGGCVSNGHDVKNVRSAFNQLSGSMQQLLETATARLKKPSPKKDLTQQLDDVHSKGKQDLRTSFLNLEETLKTKEDNLLKGAEESGRIADQSLLAKARQCEAKSVQINRLRQSIDGVSNPSSPDVTCTSEGSGSEIIKINTYVAVKNTLASLLPQSASALDAFIHITFEYPFQTGCVNRVSKQD